MLFSRRCLQERLTALRPRLGDEAVDALAARLNRPGKDRMAAMWEVVIFHSLAARGQLGLEAPLASGRRPDIGFSVEELSFTADITAVSDDGLDEQNPYHELSEAVEKAKKGLGLPIGGLNLQVHSRVETSARGERRVLRLPPRARVGDFVRDEIVPRLREQLQAGQSVLRLTIDDDDIGIDLTIDPAKSPYSSGGFAAYDVPTIKDRNPLYNALKSKALQLRGAEGLVGVIVGDADCRALQSHRPGGRNLTATQIALEFLRQYGSISFVLLLTAEEEARSWLRTERARRWIAPTLVTRPEDGGSASLLSFFSRMAAEMPAPVRNSANAALRAREAEYDFGFHGGTTMSARTIRMSLRELMETLAARRMLTDNGAKYPAAARALRPDDPSPLQMQFERALREGRLPTNVVIQAQGPGEDDDWIEFTLGEPDAAIAPFR
jgi:hypothetical protein